MPVAVRWRTVLGTGVDDAVLATLVFPELLDDLVTLTRANVEVARRRSTANRASPSAAERLQAGTVSASGRRRSSSSRHAGPRRRRAVGVWPPPRARGNFGWRGRWRGYGRTVMEDA